MTTPIWGGSSGLAAAVWRCSLFVIHVSDTEKTRLNSKRWISLAAVFAYVSMGAIGCDDDPEEGPFDVGNGDVAEDVVEDAPDDAPTHRMTMPTPSRMRNKTPNRTPTPNPARTSARSTATR